MDLNGIGYSNIRLPNNNRSYVYTYSRYVNTFPEEVFLHEFLHTLERILNEREYKIPALQEQQEMPLILILKIVKLWNIIMNQQIL